MQERVRIAVIGAGWWATATHMPALREHAGAELAAVCDVNLERARSAAEAYGVERVYTDHCALLANEPLDAAVVATTHATHFAVARDCLKAGLHVLIEKPMTLLARDARALIEAAAHVGKSILLGYPWNYAPHTREVYAELASGRLGPIQSVQSVFNSYNADLIGGRDRSDKGGYRVHGPGDVYSRKEHSGGGHGHLQMTHAAGLLFFVTGLRAKSVQARMANHGLPLDLVDAMLVEYEGGALGTISGTSNAFLSESRLSIGCASGSISMDVSARSTTLCRVNGERTVLPPGNGADLSTAPIRNLVGVALGLEEPAFPAEVGWRAVELLDAAYRSAESDGRAVHIHELYPPVLPEVMGPA